MAIQLKRPNFEQLPGELRAHGFDVKDVPGVAGEILVTKNGCGVALKKAPDGKTSCVTANPGFLLGGEISRVLDRGNQKFLKTSKLEVPATAAHLKAVHRFSEELRERAGEGNFYNEALGTVSDVYMYDRVKGREHHSNKSKTGDH